MSEQLSPGIRFRQPSYVKKRKVPRTAKQQFVVGKIVENSRLGRTETLGAIMRQAGYSDASAIKPSQLTESKGFQELLDEVMPDNELTKIHRSLLKSMKIEHMAFPLGPVGEDDLNFSGSSPNMAITEEAAERTSLTDREIIDLIADVGGTVRRIVHGQTARHVYYWAPNDKSRHDALKLAYDLKGFLNKKDTGNDPTLPGSTTYNTFIQQNNFDPNAPEARDVVDMTLESLMENTKAKRLPE